MANETEKVNTIAIADIEKINGKTDDNIENLSGLEFTGTPPDWKGTRAVIMGAGNYTAAGSARTSAFIQYKTLDSDADTADFGDLLVMRAQQRGSGSNNTRAVCGGGFSVNNSNVTTQDLDDIDYVTVASVGTVGDAGDLATGASQGGQSGASNGTLCLFMGGNTDDANIANIEHMTISSTGATDGGGVLTAASRRHAASNGDSKSLIVGVATGLVGQTNVDEHNFSTDGDASDYGNAASVGMKYSGVVCSTSRVIIGGGRDGSWNAINTIQSFAVAGGSDSTDEADLVLAVSQVSGTSDGTRGEFYGGLGGGTVTHTANPALGTYVQNDIQKITIASISNAADCGDLVTEGDSGGGADWSTGHQYSDSGGAMNMSSQTGT